MISTTTSKKIKNLILFVAGVILILIVITLIGMIKDNPIVFPSATRIVSTFFSLLGEGETYHFLGITILDFVIALLFALIFGFGLGILSGFSDISKGILKPLIIVFRSLPMIILIVIVMLTVPSKNYRYVPIVSTGLALIPIIYEPVCEGIRRVDSSYNDVWRLNSKLNLKVIANVHLPLIAGYIKQAISNAIGIGIKMVVTVEFVAGVKNTLGVAIFDSKAMIEYTEIYAYALILVLVVLLFEFVPTLLIKAFGMIKNKWFKKETGLKSV